VHVLVADRNREIGELIAYALDRAALRVVVAHDKGTALSLFAAHRPPVVVLDTVGMDVLARFKAASTDTAIIVVSALDSHDARAAALSLGVAHYLTKPFSYRELVVRVHECLRSDRPIPSDAAAD